jgi:type 1 glutamine amidotransferase
LEIVLVASKQDHGPGQHDYPAWQKKWQSLFGQASNVVVNTAWEWPSKEQFQTADVVVFYFWNHDWNAERYQQLDEYLARGGGVAVFHSATIADKDPEQLAERIGLASQPQRTKYLHTPLDLKIVAPANHPITLGLPRQIHFLDEPYWPMIGDASKVEVLATTIVEGEERPMIWTWQKGRGRVFASILGHYTWTFDDPSFRLLALRGIAWAAGESGGRLEKLATTEVDLK